MAFVVNVLPPDQFSYPSIENGIKALSQLETVFDKIMTSIETKLVECQSQLTHLSTRVSASSAKINQIEGVAQALTIRSAPTFPKVEAISSKLFVAEPTPPKPELKFHIQDHFGMAPMGSIDDIAHLGNMQLSMSCPAPTLKDRTQKHEEIGLGTMPKTLSQVTSLLLFNSSANPYNLDDFDIQADIEREERRRANAMILHDAPKILSIGDDVRFRKQDFNFQPQMADMPKMEFADALNIAGIASIGWEDEDEEDEGDDFFGGGGFGAPMKSGSKAASKAEPGLPSLPRADSLPSQPKGPALPNLGPPPPAATPTPPLPSLGPAPTQQAPSNPPLPSLGSAPKAAPPAAKPAVQTPALPQIAPTPTPPLPSVPPPPKDVDLPPPSSDRNALLASIRTENPMARLRKAPDAPASTTAKPAAKGLARNPMDVLKEKIQQRNRELNVKTEEAVRADIPFPRSQTTIPPDKKGSDSEWSSDSD
mmetsp:Transcript_32626/g.56677  ORF Transcript_32626/g.56677 Transcript_32626/m.56677 type:complete len:479 (+) Transcript_32626:2215-3651(+)